MNMFFQKLKTDTNNDNISRLGQIKVSGIMNDGQSDVIFNTKIPSPFTIYAKGATPTEVQCNAGTNDVIFTPDIASEPFTLIISPSYGAEYLLKNRFTYTYYNLNEFGWFDVTKFKNASFASLAGNNECEGDVSTFKKYINIETLSFAQAKNITGDIMDACGEMTKLTSLTCVTCGKLTGRIETLVEKQIAVTGVSARASNTTIFINVKYINGITLNNSNIIPRNYNLNAIFLDDTVEIRNASNNVRYAVYTKASGTWAYENGA